MQFIYHLKAHAFEKKTIHTNILTSTSSSFDKLWNLKKIRTKTSIDLHKEGNFGGRKREREKKNLCSSN